MIDDAILITAVGTTLTTSASSVNAAIPNNSSGKPPNYVRISVTQGCFVKFGTTSGVAATTNDILIMPSDSGLFKISGCTYIAAIQQGSSGLCNITPLEDL